MKLLLIDLSAPRSQVHVAGVAVAGSRVFQEEEFLGKDGMEISDSGHKTVGWPELWQWRGVRLDWSLPCLDRQGGVPGLRDLQLLCKGRKASGEVGMGGHGGYFCCM